MRLGERYRLKVPTLGIHIDGDPRRTETIPQNSIVTVLGAAINGGRMVDVIWNGKTLMVFAQDLRERGNWLTGLARSQRGEYCRATM